MIGQRYVATQGVAGSAGSCDGLEADQASGTTSSAEKIAPIAITEVGVPVKYR
jgi:hypothetical protein